MMRLLFLCLMLLLPVATAVSDDDEGSGNDERDDEDLSKESRNFINSENMNTGKTTGEDESSSQITPIVIIAVVATVMILSIAAIGTTMLVKRHMRLQQQAIYSVPTEQNQKEAI